MTPRDPTEPHRVATPLELFLDLAFVVAIAQAAAGLHHGLVDGHVGDALIGFPAVFFAIWWAWMNFAWFGSAYDCDDALYRLAVFVQMTGVLVMAAGIPRAFDDRDLAVMTFGYVIMRLALVGQWLRVAFSDPSRRRTALRYAVGITVVQVGVAAPAAPARELVRPRLPRAGGRRAGRAGLGRSGRADALAPAPHRRALRPVHDHRARRVGARRHVGRPGRPRRRQHLRRPRRRRGRRPPAGVLDVVDLLRPPVRADGGPGPAGVRRSVARSRSSGAMGTTWCSAPWPRRGRGWRCPSTR